MRPGRLELPPRIREDARSGSSASGPLRSDHPRATDDLPGPVERLDLHELRGAAERDRGLEVGPGRRRAGA